ncbi:MAG: hypothetical protein Q9218_007658, partial [Villophora microphyllina]
TPTPADRDATSAQIFDLTSDRFVASDIHNTAASFAQALEVEAQKSRLRVILIGYLESWDVNRDIVDVLCSRPIRIYQTDGDELIDEIRQMDTLQRQVEAFLATVHRHEIESHYNIDQGQATCRALSRLTEDLRRLLSHIQDERQAGDSLELAHLIEAQLDESKEAKKTSVKLGYLSQLAYIFLPLQLTASAMGMNLKGFGTGNIEFRTFFSMLAVIATLSFVPVLFPLLLRPSESRLSQIRATAKYSKRAAFLFGWFCLFHAQSINDRLWSSGMRYSDRASISTSLTRGPFNFFPHYWQRVLDELFTIIDTPEWGRKDMSYHTA